MGKEIAEEMEAQGMVRFGTGGLENVKKNHEEIGKGGAGDTEA